MGKIIDSLLKDIKSTEMTIQVKEICNSIWNEEKNNITYSKIIPDGANIFIALEVPAKTKGEVSFLTLERDPMEEYISVYYSIRIVDIKDIPQMPRKYQVHKIEGRSATKILTEFAKLIKFYRGE